METFEVKVNEEVMNYLEAAYVEYRAKQDILNSIIDLHSYDDNDAVIHSKPFQSYEKQFAEAKFKYDTIMTEVQNSFIPEDVRDAGCRWEADFQNGVIKVTPL